MHAGTVQIITHREGALVLVEVEEEDAAAARLAVLARGLCVFVCDRTDMHR
jgi:hypothetical protein